MALIMPFMRHHLKQITNSLVNELSNTGSDYLKLVKDAVVFIEAAELGAEILVDGEGLDWLRLHMQVPNFHRQIVPGNIRTVR